MLCIHAQTLSQSKFGIRSSNVKTDVTHEVTVRHRFNWIILTAPGAPCVDEEYAVKQLLCYLMSCLAIGLVIFLLLFSKYFSSFKFKP